jgi:hypothetical protein
MARVLRTRRSPGAAPVPSTVEQVEPVTIEMGGARITVGRGFDRATLAAVVEVLSLAAGTRR